MSENAIHVLLVESDGDEASIVRSHLAGRPVGALPLCEVASANRLAAASHLLARDPFDVIVLDLAVPGTTGLDGFRKLHAQRPDLPVVILTGAQDEALAAEAVAHGAQDYLIKGSLDCCLIKRAIRSAIDRKRLSNQIERLLERDPSAILVVESSGLVRYANPAAGALLGLPRESLVGKPFVHTPAAGSPSRVSLSFRGAPERTFDMTADEITWNGAGARQITLRDVTDSVRLRAVEAGLLHDQRRIEIKNQFLGRISHELRNSLATVKTAVFCLNEEATGALTPRQARLIEMISRNVDRQARIIDNILDLSRLQSGSLKTAPRPFALDALVEETAAEFRAKQKGRRLTVDTGADLPPVDGDPDLLVQVLRNLLDNAFRYARGQVAIKAKAAGPDELMVVVSDDGPGVPRERLPELFDGGMQASSEDGAKGSGLGLAICREIIEGHRGRIWAEPAAPHGTRIVFTLPRAVTSRSKISDPAGMVPVKTSVL